jgi:hypothetical protein
MRQISQPPIGRMLHGNLQHRYINIRAKRIKDKKTQGYLNGIRRVERIERRAEMLHERTADRVERLVRYDAERYLCGYGRRYDRRVFTSIQLRAL